MKNVLTVLIILGLIIVPYYSTADVPIRELKLTLCMIFCLLISLFRFAYGGYNQIRNYWLLSFIGFIFLSYMCSPKPEIGLNNMNISNFWVWEPYFYFIISFLSIYAISQSDFSNINLKCIFNVLMYSGGIMAVYTILQLFHVEQFFESNGQVHEQWNIVGTLGHPTFVSPFVAMLIPIAIYFRKHFLYIIMIISVIASRSAVSIGAMVLTLLFIFAIQSKRNLILSGIGLIIVSCLFIYSKSHIVNEDFQRTFDDSGRYKQWIQIIKDIKDPITNEGQSYPFTGFGLGSFRWIYHIKHDNNFKQAHNEFLEIMYCLGLIGIFLFIKSYINFIKDGLSFGFCKYRKMLLSSIFCISICAGGTFVWHLGGTIFYSIVIFGLYLNKSTVEVIK